MEKLDEDWNGLELWVLRTCSFLTPVLTPVTNVQLTLRASSGKHCAGVAKIWLFGPHALLSNQNSFPTPVLTLQKPFLLFVTFNMILGDIVWLCHPQVKQFLKFYIELTWKTRWTVSSHDAVLYFGMLYMVCIAENCKQKNEVSGYETL